MRNAPPRRSYRSLASQIESLEQRLVFSVLTVNTLGDNINADANLSFREAVLLVNNLGDSTLALGRTLTAGELAQINTTEPFGTDDDIFFVDALDGQTITLATEVAITRSMTIHGEDDISFAGGGNNRAFNIGAVNVTIEDTILSNFGTTGTAGVTGTTGDGGAIYLNGGNLTLRDVDFINNIARGGDGSTTAGNGRGGAVFKTGAGELEIIGSTFTGNQAVGGVGSGGGGQGGAIFSASTVNVITVQTSDFISNSATGNSAGSVGGVAQGGAMYIFGGNANIRTTTFDSNNATSGAGTAVSGVAGTAARGGAIWNDGILSIDNVVLDQNTAAGASRTGTDVTGGNGQGGALYTENDTTITDTTLSFNIAAGGNANGSNTSAGGVGTGGAVHAAGNITIERVTLNNNTVAGGVAFGGSANTGGDGRGGAVYSSGALQLINSTLALNTAEGTPGNAGGGSGRGGGVYVDAGDAAINFATIASNTAAEGGAGIHLQLSGGEALSLRNSILSNVGVDIARTGSATSVTASNNLIRNTVLSGLGIVSTADPLLTALANNGGPTQTMALQPGSPALNAGGATAVTVDQRGQNRVKDGVPDLGAVEISTRISVTGGTIVIAITRDGTTASGSVPNPFTNKNVQQRLAVGDINNDDIDDVIVASGQGTRNRVVVYNSLTGAVLADFQPIAGRYGGGLFVASGDVNNDGFDDIIVGRGAGPSQVLVYSGNGLGLLADFRPFAGGGGARVASTDLNADGFAEIIVGTGAGRTATVGVFNGQQIIASGTAIPTTFNPFGTKYRGGVYLATGDINDDGTEDIIVSKAAPRNPAVSVFNANGAQITTFTTPSNNGVRVGSYDYNGDGNDDIYTSVTTGGKSLLKVYSGIDNALLATIDLGSRKPIFVG